MVSFPKLLSLEKWLKVIEIQRRERSYLIGKVQKKLPERRDSCDRSWNSRILTSLVEEESVPVPVQGNNMTTGAEQAKKKKKAFSMNL